MWRAESEVQPGEDRRVRTRRAISDEAIAFVTCFSAASLKQSRDGQYEELVLAIEQMRQIQPDQPWLFPVRFDDCEIPRSR